MKKILILVLISMFFLSGCSTLNTQGRSFPFEIMLQLTDLPASYEHLDSGLSDVENGTACKVSFKNKNNFIGSSISHVVAIFKEDTSAEKYFNSLVDNYLTNAYLPEGLTFIPVDSTDIYQLGCVDVSIDNVPTETCKLIQLHDDYVVQVTTNINEMNLEMSDFNKLLQVLDSRLPGESKTDQE